MSSPNLECERPDKVKDDCDKVPLTPSLVHRIMLCPSDHFSLLTIDGGPRSRTLFFQNFLVQEGFSCPTTSSDPQRSTLFAQQISHTMKQAFHANILEEISSSQSYAPLHSLILEVHQKIRSLIPNRTDLHSILNDDAVRRICFDKENSMLFHKMLQLLYKIAESLISLESEDRSISTREWMKIISEFINNFEEQNNSQDSIAETTNNSQVDQILPVPPDAQTLKWENPVPTQKQWILASTTFLHRKAEQCFVDIQNFHLGHIVAPNIHANSVGIDFLRREFQIKFSNGCNENGSKKPGLSIPHTETWLKEIIETCGLRKETLIASKDKKREALLRTGWVDNILFRSPRDIDKEESSEDCSKKSSLLMPEVFYLDLASVRAIRMTTRLSVIGSALALHASAIAGVDNSIFCQDPLDSNIEECKKKIINAMKNPTVGRQELFEKRVGDEVVNLARVLSPNISRSLEEMIKNRCVTTMNGQDPVIKLLDNRMRSVFRDMVTFQPKSFQQGIPTSIRTGIGIASSDAKSDDGTFESLAKKAAKEEFVKNGFSFYSEELSENTIAASRVVNLALRVHGPTIDKLFLDTCQE